MKWDDKQIGDVAEIYSGYAFKSVDMILNEEPNSYPVIKIKNVNDRSVSKECDSYLPESSFKSNYSKYTLLEGDILVAMTGQGSVGRIGKMREIDKTYLVNQRVGIVRVDSNIASPEFIYQQISNSKAEKYYYDLAFGAGQPNLSPTDIASLKIKYPPLPTQRKIASILSAYDDLIENNLKRIKLLEEKAFLRYMQIVRDEKLTEKSILDICYITDGTHDSPKQQTEGFYLVTGKHLIGGFIDFSSAYFISETDHDKIQKRSKIDDGDLILSNIGTIGNVAIIEKQFDFSVKNVIIFKPNRIEFSPFLYCYLNSSEMQTRFQQESSGTSQRFISLRYCRDLKVRVPKEDVLKEFYQEVSDLLKLKSLLNQQNTKLREARDFLLPKLMNGQIEVL